MPATSTEDTKTERDFAALIAEGRKLLAKATPGPWEVDHEKNEGSYGEGDNDRTGYNSAFIIGPDGKRLFDSLNSDAACIREENGGDEHGDWLDAWDEVSIANADLVVWAKNNLPAVLERAASSSADGDAALEPFALIAAQLSPSLPDDTPIELKLGDATIYTLALGNLRAARAALAKARGQ